MNKKIILIIAAAGILHAGCSKNEHTDVAFTQPVNRSAKLLAQLRTINQAVLKCKTGTAAKTTASYINTNNPYDNIGAQHNDVLDYVQTYAKVIRDRKNPLGKLSIFQDSTTYDYFTYQEKTIAVIAEYAYENNMNQGNYATIYANLMSVYTSNLSTNVSPKDLTPVCNTDYYDGGDNYMTAWIGSACALDTLADSINLTLKEGLLEIYVHNYEDNGVEATLDLITQYENDIIAYQVSYPGTLSQAVYQKELTALAVMRYSIYYWYTVSKNPQCEWYINYDDVLTGAPIAGWAGGFGAYVGDPSVVGPVLLGSLCSGMMYSCFE